MLLVLKALARVLNFSVLNSQKLGSDEGRDCPKNIIERLASPITKADKELRSL